MSRTHNAGIVTAYGAAVRGGYTGTYEQFCAQQAQYAENARQMEQAVSDVRQIKTSVESAVSEAEGYASNANQSATNASNSATQASESASNANQSANNASSSADSASQSASSAQTSANNASTSEQNAHQSAEDAHQSAEDAQDVLESVQTEGDTQIGRVQAKGDEVIELIPEDYTQMQTDIQNMSAEISNNEIDILKAFPTDSATGTIASFSDGADDIPVKNLTVYIEPIQSGTGGPSPDNIRPISGWTGITLTCNNKTINIDWTDEAGEVFGGTLNVTTGVLTKTHAFSKLPSTGWSVSGGVNFWHNNSGMSLSNPAKIGYCSHYPCVTDISGNGVIIFGKAGFSTVSRIVIRDNNFATVSDLEAYLSAQKEAGTPVTVAYPLATPRTYQLTPQEVKTILGENNIFADTGDVFVEYRADIKKYINKVVATAVSALS